MLVKEVPFANEIIVQQAALLRRPKYRRRLILWQREHEFAPLSMQTLIIGALLLSIEQPAVVDIGVNFLELNTG